MRDGWRVGSLNKAAAGACTIAQIVAGLGLALAPVRGHGSPPKDLPAEEGQSEPIARRPLLLIMTEDDPLGSAVAEAIETELNDLEVRVEVRLEPLAPLAAVELRERIELGERMVRERGALGLLWIETRDDGLVIHLVVADLGMLRRPVVGFDDPSAATETAAVIIRHFVLDLLAGRPIGLTGFPREAPIVEVTEVEPEPVADEPGDTPSVQPPAPLLDDRGHFRLQAGYVGQPWLRERAWEHGIEINAGWRFAVGAHIEAGLALSPAFAVELRHPGNLGAAQLRVRRYPVGLAIGYQHVWKRPRLALDAQLRIIAEVIERGVFDPNRITPQLDRPIHVVPALEPRLVLDYLAIPQLAVFVAVGVRTSLIRVDYQVSYVDEAGTVIANERPLTPRIVAPVVLAGVDMYF